ncbi:unnamed protein product [Wickerhamomyces anomalus]
MRLSIRFLFTFGVVTTFVQAFATPDALALPWAHANPQAYAAAQAYADAYAEAIAIGHPDPEAYALAASDDDCATIACHASCGLLIIAGTECSLNSENTYAGPYNKTCLCEDGTDFINYYTPCMDCGWTLWKYYGGYVSSALAACETLSTEPTGTLRCSTTLTDSYTIDTSIQGCSYLGNCPTTTAESTTTSSSVSPSVPTTQATSTSSKSSTSTVTSANTYTGTTYTVTTDLSFTYSYSPDGETTDCFTTSYHYPTATNNPIDMDFISWDDKHFDTTNYTTYFFLNFTSDQSDVTDIRLITGTDMATAVLTPDSQIWVNLHQGVMGFVTSAQNNMAAYNLGILITYKGTNYLYAYSCKTDRLTLKYLQLDKSEYDSCYTMSFWGYWNDAGYCTHREDPITTTVEFRPESSETTSTSNVPSTSSSKLSSSSSDATTKSSSSSATSASSEVPSTHSSERTSNSVSTDSSSISSDIVPSTSASTAPSESLSSLSSSQSIAPTVSNSASSESMISSSSTSSSSSSPTAEPFLSGELVNGQPQWELSIAGALGPWNSVSVICSQNQTNVFNYDNAVVYVNNVAMNNVSISYANNSIDLSFMFNIKAADVVIVQFGGEVIGEGQGFTSLVHLTIVDLNTERIVKRGEMSWDLSYTIDAEVTSSKSEISSLTSSESSDGISTATTILTEDTTTIVTITSCSEDQCTEVETTAQVTVVTVTEDDIVTSYTTYCPTSEPETTIVTVTSCSQDKCSQVESSAHITVITSTQEGVVTTFTTYCPISFETAVSNTGSSTKTIESTSETAGVAQNVGSSSQEVTTTSYVTQIVTVEYTSVSEGVTKVGTTTSEVVKPASSTPAEVSTYEGSANMLIRSGLVGLVFMVLL